MARALIVLVIAVVVSGFVAGMVQMEIGIAYDAHEELVVAMVMEIAFTLVVALVFAFVLLARGGTHAVDVAAAAVFAASFVALGALESFAISGEGGAAVAIRDVPVLIEMGVPALITIVIQWLLVRRHVGRSAPPAPVASVSTG
jgi:hypothetical protein